MDNLLKTSLHQTHIDSKAKLVPFAGWEMPIQYSSILSECKAVRTQSGIFDVSHMGRFYISWNDESLGLDKILSVDPSQIEEGQGKYNVICNQNGGIIDDAIVYKINNKKFLLIPNASNADKIYEWVSDNTKNLDFEIEVVTKNTAMIALQGPTSRKILNNIFPDLPKIRRFRFIETKYNGKNVTIARTGYTGENGFEIQGRNIARSHNIIKDNNNNTIGEVTSGSYSPTLSKSIGLGYVSDKSLDINSEITIEIRSKNIPAKITKIPFYKRSK